MVLKIVMLSLCILTTALFLLVRVKFGGTKGVITKALASFAFVATGVVALYVNGGELFAVFIVLGLICGLIGDIVLDLKVVYPSDNNIYLNTGMFSFGVGHIFYFLGLFTYVLNNINYKAMSTPIYIPILIGVAIAVLLCGGILLSSKLMKLDFGKFFWQSGTYSILLTSLSTISICLAVAYSIEILWLFVMGAVMFLISDLILSLNYFGGKENDKMLIFFNHLFYYIAQISIAGFLFF